jgi:hypothetical protein
MDNIRNAIGRWIVKFRCICCLILSFLSVASSTVTADQRSVPPFKNPHLADSSYAVTHDRHEYTALAGPVDRSRGLRADEVIWKPLGPFNTSMLMYSGIYPDGGRVIWVGGYDRIAKLDAETLDVLATYAIGGNTFFTEEETRRHIATMDSLAPDDMVAYAQSMWAETLPYLSSWYRFLTSDNELIMGHRHPDGKVSIRVYAEENKADRSSRIRLVREWSMPKEVGYVYALYGMQMTSDGTIVMATQDGAVIALDSDFSRYDVLQLKPKLAADEGSNDLFNAYVRNGFSVDDQGGIYVVTRDNLHRIQWTGHALSTDSKDGAWVESYKNEVTIGSGTTPALVGWGPDEDKLVLIADGARNNQIVAYWRHDIPRDWQGLSGHARRVAGVTDISFGISADENVRIENALMVKDYGIFVDNSDPINPVPEQGSRIRNWLAEAYYMNQPDYVVKGGAKVEWDPKTRTLNPAWSSQLNFSTSICTISDATQLLYCWGNRAGDWTLEAVDWATGESAFHYNLGKSQKYNVYGGPIIIAPNGSIDCACNGGLGLVRISPGKTERTD